ncbi:MAG: type II toxin-antitoxin system RelE/ParE family toxin [Clostridiales bacterium]|nr:type II toxin-antitoxin system RelE/ParE family toxin [Clostridiales bacterium]
MIIHTYKSGSGRDLILEYINGLSKAETVDGLSVLKSMEDNRLDELNYKPWQGKIWEVYFYKHNRIFYVTVEGENVYLLHACRKQKNKTEKKDKDIVIKRAKELGGILNKKLI